MAKIFGYCGHRGKVSALCDVAELRGLVFLFSSKLCINFDPGENVPKEAGQWESLNFFLFHKELHLQLETV